MTELFVVTAGECADYHIVDVFSTRELAQAYCEIHNDGKPVYPARIETYHLDELVIQPDQKHAYYIHMHEDGFVVSGWHAMHGAESNKPLTLTTSTNIYRKREGKLDLRGIVIADNYEQALTIAYKKRLELLATGEWEVDKIEDKDNVQT